MSSVQLVFVLFGLCALLHSSYGSTIATEVDGNVQLTGTGETELIIPDKLTFEMPSTCRGSMLLCYTSVSTSSDQSSYRNIDGKCPQNTCLIVFEKVRAVALTVAEQGDIIVGSLHDEFGKLCPLKANNGQQKFIIKEMPGCAVTVIGAKLPSTEPKKKTEEVTENATEKASKQSVLWLIPTVASIVASIVVVAIVAFCIYKQCKKSKKTKAPKSKLSWRRRILASLPKSPAPTSPAPATPAPTSPMQPAPTSPMTIPTTPNEATTPTTVVPVTKSPTVVTPVREAEQKPRQPRSQSVPPPAPSTQQPRPTRSRSIATTTVATKTLEADDSPQYEVAVKYTEHSPISLHRNKLLDYIGMMPSITGSALHPFLQHVFSIYNTYRKVEEYEYDFFGSITSEAWKQAAELIKKAREALCSHGAVFDHGRFVSFSKDTHLYITQRTTPGFVAWYGFAAEHGAKVKIPLDEKADGILAKLSVPALLTVFFREDLTDQVRRSAFARLRRLLPQLYRHHPTMALKGMPYPINLIPELRDRNSKKFDDAANDESYSIELDRILQQRKDNATKEEHPTDETQASSVKILNVETGPTLTLHDVLSR